MFIIAIIEMIPIFGIALSSYQQLHYPYGSNYIPDETNYLG